MSKLVFFLIFLISVNIIWGQTYSTRVRVKIPENREIIRTDKIICPKRIDSGSIVKKEYSFENNDSTFSVIRIDTLKKNTSYNANKNVSINIEPFGGWANITADEKDKSILHVNYWLNPEQKIKAKTEKPVKIVIHKYSIPCSDKDIMHEDTAYAQTLFYDTTIYLYPVSPEDTGTVFKQNWYKRNTTKIDVYDDTVSKEPCYYLVNKYDRDADYIIKLQNREFISFRYRSWDFGAITIPFKYRFGYKKYSKTVDPEFQSDLNLGIFGGYTFLGRYRQRLEGEELKDLSRISATLGGFLNISTTDLDSSSTTMGKIPFVNDKKATIGVVSIGIGTMVTIYNFQVGVFVGIDKGVSPNANNWNFNNKPWIGFGIGYNLKNLFFK